MAQIETWFECDLQRTVEVVPLKGHLYAADEGANLFGVVIVSNGHEVPVSGTLVCYGLRNDGVTVRAQANITNSARPSITLTHDFYTVVGPMQIILRLVSGVNETVLAACTTYVFKTTTGTLIDSGSALPTIESLVEKINACERAATAANEAASAANTQVNSAAQSASQANQRATAAETAASNAARDALAASQDAQAAARNANTAAQDAANASNNASAAAQSAESARSAAAAMAEDATTASLAASNAADSARAAATAAGNAETQARNAAGSAAQAQQDASQAASQSGQAVDTANDAAQRAETIQRAFNEAFPTIVTGGVVRDNSLYLLHGDEIVAGPFSGFGGGGGGGGGGTVSGVEFSFTGVNNKYDFIFGLEDDCVIPMQWSSLEDDEPTGSGTLKLLIDGVQKFSKTVPQGTLYQDVTAYLGNATSATLVFQLYDAYNNRRVKSFSVTRIDLRITSSFDASIFQYGLINFTFTPYGNIQKTVHFEIDGTELTPLTTAGYGRMMSYNIPAQEHGSHRLRVWYTGTIEGTAVSSNTLIYDLICIDPESDEVIIASPFSLSQVDQYSTINIPFIVYNPQSPESDVEILINGGSVSVLTGVDRTQHIFSKRMDNTGATVISIVCGNTTKTFILTVNAVQNMAQAETEGLRLYLTSAGRSNLEANPANWVSYQNGTTVNAQMTGFNFINDGWVLDDTGATVLRVRGNARVEIPYKPFATDKRANGFTIEIDFATHDVRNYESPILSCINGGRGILLTSQRCELHSEGSTINMQFKEEEHVRVSFVVEKRTDLRLIYCYINGVMSGVTRYPVDDNFQQVTPQNITIGSNDSTMDIYNIRIYETNLSMQQIEDNWIADTQDGELMLNRFGRNNIRNESDEVVVAKLPSDLPYMIITAAALPQYKGDKKPCSGTYVDPVHTEKSFTFENCEIDVQGTSSQYYYRKNYDMKFNGGFTDPSGNTSSKYKLRDDSIPVKRFVMKADVASSEGANNVELVRLYNRTCPYKTPAQISNPLVRQGIDGFPIVIFWNNSETNVVSFLGKYNFNNAKGTPEVYGFVEGDESWEMRNSGSNRVLYKDDYFSNVKDDTDEFGNPVASWQKDFECRYPNDEYFDYTQLQEFVSWVKSTDPNQATNEALAETADFGETETVVNNGVMSQVPITYTHDTAAYRRAKFRAQLADYVEVDSAIFYYLFTEVFLMVDSRAKNSFPSFMGTPIVSAEESNE